MKDLDKRDMPLYIIILSLLIVFPLGVYYIVLKTEKKLRDIKRVANNFKLFGFLWIVIGVIYFLGYISSNVGKNFSKISASFTPLPKELLIFVETLFIIVSQLSLMFFLWRLYVVLELYGVNS